MIMTQNSCAYASQWPKLSEATNGMDPALLNDISRNPSFYSVEVQIEFADYDAFCNEWEQWSIDQDLEKMGY
jgi:hypothetical protein